MKKARTVSVPEDRPLTNKECIDLSEHAFNSSLWYASNYMRNAAQVRDKLYRKGYPKNEVEVKDSDGKVFTVNLVEETIERLIEYEVISDASYAEGFLKKRLNGGVGLSKAKMELKFKGVSEEEIQAAERAIAEEGEFTEDDALMKAALKVANSSSFDDLPDFKKRQKLFRSLASKGFPMDDIGPVVNQLLSGEDDDGYL